MFRNFISPCVSVILAILSLGMSGTAKADYADDVVSIELLPGWRTDHGTHMAAVRLTLAPGWKTYWRAPGEGGIPPQMDFEGSRNITAVETHFPTPEVFFANGMRSIGYSKVVVLPLEFRVPRPGEARLNARFDLGICEDICMPMSVDLRATLPSEGARDRAILEALAARPATFDTPIECAITPISDGIRMDVTYAAPPGVSTLPVSVVEPGDPTIWMTDTITEMRGGMITSSVELVPPRGRPLMLDRSAIRVTVLGGARGFELRGCD